jgi:hypothetical protein
VLLVDQRRVTSVRAIDELSGRLGSADVERDGDDLEPFGVELFTQFLPDRQVESAASPGRPREQ